jgi:hypothetical protein
VPSSACCWGDGQCPSRVIRVTLTVRRSAPQNVEDSLLPGGQVLSMRGHVPPGPLANNKSLALCDDAAEQQMPPTDGPKVRDGSIAQF